MKKINKYEVSALVRYDEASPSRLSWNVNVRRFKAGTPAGCFNHHNGYWYVTLNKSRYKAHRVIMVLHGHSVDGLEVDHINGVRSDNNVSNLRLVTSAVNRRNAVPMPSNVSGVQGVAPIRRGGQIEYWIATWTDQQGKNNRKFFSVKKLGDAGSMDSAIAFRKQKVIEMNSFGAGYTNRHTETFQRKALKDTEGL